MRPRPNGTGLAAVTTASQAFALPDGGGGILQLQNIGAGAVAYARMGENNGALTQVPTGIAGQLQGGVPILANAAVPTVITLRANDTHVALIASANCSVLLTRADFP